MLARCTRTFRDLETGELRMTGSTFEVTEERLDKINSTRYGTLAEVIADDAKGEVAEKPRQRRASRRKETAEQ